jgi:hypothetical protein
MIHFVVHEEGDGVGVVVVQWHPERPDLHIPGFDAEARKLYKAFAVAVRAKAAG